jgi:hypothetical protein
MAFKRRYPFKSKIVMNNNSIEQINMFNYPGCNVSYQNGNDITVKISKFLQLRGIINGTLEPSHVQKHTRLKI